MRGRSDAVKKSLCVLIDQRFPLGLCPIESLLQHGRPLFASIDFELKNRSLRVKAACNGGSQAIGDLVGLTGVGAVLNGAADLAGCPQDAKTRKNLLSSGGKRLGISFAELAHPSEPPKDRQAAPLAAVRFFPHSSGKVWIGRFKLCQDLISRFRLDGPRGVRPPVAALPFATPGPFRQSLPRSAILRRIAHGKERNGPGRDLPRQLRFDLGKP
ncbi:MAG: hypothetical protein AAFZ67_09460 [Planctomycetota bacterium]